MPTQRSWRQSGERSGGPCLSTDRATSRSRLSAMAWCGLHRLTASVMERGVPGRQLGGLRNSLAGPGDPDRLSSRRRCSGSSGSVRSRCCSRREIQKPTGPVVLATLDNPVGDDEGVSSAVSCRPRGAPGLLELPRDDGGCLQAFQWGEAAQGTLTGSVGAIRSRAAADGFQASSRPAGLRAADSRMAASTALRS